MVSKRRVRGGPLAAVLLILLTLPLGVSAAPRSEDRAVRQTGFGIWRAIPDLWHTIQGFFENEGSSLDPFGNPKPNSIFERAGSSLDPFGNPKADTVTDPLAAGSLAEH